MCVGVVPPETPLTSLTGPDTWQNINLDFRPAGARPVVDNCTSSRPPQEQAEELPKGIPAGEGQ